MNMRWRFPGLGCIPAKAALGPAAALLILMTSPGVQAQQTPTNCLSASDNHLIRLSGRIIHVQLEHPLGHYKIDGYGLALMTPRCFDTTSLQDNHPLRLDIDQVGLSSIFASHSEQAREKFWDKGKNRHRWDDMDRFVRDNVGKLMTVIGTVEDDPTPP